MDFVDKLQMGVSWTLLAAAETPQRLLLDLEKEVSNFCGWWV